MIIRAAVCFLNSLFFLHNSKKKKQNQPYDGSYSLPPEFPHALYSTACTISANSYDPGLSQGISDHPVLEGVEAFSGGSDPMTLQLQGDAKQIATFVSGVIMVRGRKKSPKFPILKRGF